MEEINSKTFKVPPYQRGEGQPSPKLREYLRSAAAGVALTAQLMMVLMFKFFFSEYVLDAIATFTNAKATEMVYKKKVRRSDDKFYHDTMRCPGLAMTRYVRR